MYFQTESRVTITYSNWPENRVSLFSDEKQAEEFYAREVQTLNSPVNKEFPNPLTSVTLERRVVYPWAIIKESKPERSTT